MKPLDDELADKIRDAFDRYDEPVDPVALDSMRQNLRAERARRSAVLYRILAAAVLLLSVTGYWISQYGPSLFNSLDTGSSLVSQSEQSPQSQAMTVNQDSSAREALSAGQESGFNVTSSSPTDLSDQGNRAVPRAAQDHQANLRAARVDQATDRVARDDRAFSIDNYNAIVQNDTTPMAVASIDTTILMDSGIPVHPTEGQNEQPIAALRQQVNGQQQGMEIQSGGQRLVTSSDIPLSQKAGIALDLIFGSMVNYTSNQFAEGFGVMAGAMHSWKLNDVVSVATGGLLSFNRFEVDPRRGSRSQGSDFGTLLTHTESDGSFDFDIETRNEFRYVAIDIPMNATLNIATIGKSKYNVTMGVSSLLYLQQSFRKSGVNYAGTLTQGEVTGQYEMRLSSNSFETRETADALNRFDFARLMNLSVGYELDRGTTNIALELYMKYPLGDITSRNLSLGMGGLTLRYGIGR